MRIFTTPIFFLIVLNLSYAQSWNFELFDTSNSALPSNDVSSLALDKHNQLWAATPYGLGKYANDQWSKLLVNGSIEDISRIWATGDSLWVSTTYYGFWRFFNEQWLQYIGSGIVGFAIGENDTIFKLDKFGEFAKWSGNSWIPIVGYIDHPEFLFADSQKNIWAGSSNMGLFKYHNGSLFQFQNYIMDTTLMSYIPAAQLMCMAEDTHHDVWVGTGDNGVLKYNGSAWSVLSVPSDANVLDIDIDDINSLWLATDEGIMRYENNTWLVFDSTNSPLPDNLVVSIEIENANTVWAALGYHERYWPYIGKGIVKLSNTTAIEAYPYSELHYNLYPNPTGGILHLYLTDINLTNMRIAITDINGRKVYGRNHENILPGLTIDLSHCSTGIYIVTLECDDFSFTDRIVVID